MMRIFLVFLIGISAFAQDGSELPAKLENADVSFDAGKKEMTLKQGGRTEVVRRVE